MDSGIDPQLIQRIKWKMKQSRYKERVKALVMPLSRADLQNEAKIKAMVHKISTLLDEPISSRQLHFISRWIIAQQIDPKNKWQLLRLWSLFR